MKPALHKCAYILPLLTISNHHKLKFLQSKTSIYNIYLPYEVWSSHWVILDCINVICDLIPTLVIIWQITVWFDIYSRKFCWARSIKNCQESPLKVIHSSSPLLCLKVCSTHYKIGIVLQGWIRSRDIRLDSDKSLRKVAGNYKKI